jgi:hypothetical protein
VKISDSTVFQALLSLVIKSLELPSSMAGLFKTLASKPQGEKHLGRDIISNAF